VRFPPLQRSGEDRILLGVCGGLGRTFGVDVPLVRLLFAALVLVGGLGFVVYGALVVLLPSDPGPKRPRDERRGEAIGITALLLAAAIGLGARGLIVPAHILVPVALLAGGVALVWRQVIVGREAGADADAEAGAGASDRPRPALREVARLVGGLALLAGGAALFLGVSGNLAELSSALIAAAVVAAGLGLLVGPRLVRARAEADVERRERIRSEELAHVAAQLHDSVLQTLALIQRVDDPRRAQSLARQQERELRAWLYGGEQPPGAGGIATLASALRAAANDVEEHYGVAVDLVQPSDGPLDDGLAALAAAAREAMTNAGRHAGIGDISVLARVADREASVFVRDRGAGFDLDAVAGDRHGVRESIVARMARAGGTASIVTAPGEGTEVELVLPRRGPSAARRSDGASEAL
jgi:signal transduction histidine kinase/phage shock protein PspC (stress-responsive transcriptional regulator)